MSKPIDRFKKTSVKYSITGTTVAAQVKDKQAPYTLIEWLENSGLGFGNTEQFIDQYNQYLRVWSDTKRQTSAENKKTTKETYIALLKDIVLNYTTKEEKRYFATLDYNSALDLDAVIPFFARRLKEIALYMVKKRSDIKYQKIKYSLRGSVEGIKKLIYNNIVNIISRDDIVLVRDVVVPDISKVVSSLQIHINELYDLSEDYYDIDSVTSVNTEATTATTNTTTY